MQWKELDFPHLCDQLSSKLFRYFTKNGFYVMDEQNFGADFAIYRDDPEKQNSHAEFLVFSSKEAKLYLLSRTSTVLKKRVPSHSLVSICRVGPFYRRAGSE